MLKITRGIRKQPLRVLVYGGEGVGKTSFAASFPNALILDTEGGSHFLDVARADIKDWPALMVAVRGLVVDPQGFKTIVIDTADWAEKALLEDICKKADKKSIEDFAFGKGHVMAEERFRDLLDACDGLIGAGVHVVLTCHQTVKRVSPPDMSEGYDRFEPRLGKHVGGLVQDWSDLTLFATWDDRVITNASGKAKAKGGRERIMHTQRCAAWSAKSRFELPEKLPLSVESIASLLDVGTAERASETVRTAANAMLAKIREGLDKDPAKVEDAIAYVERIGKQEQWPQGEIDRIVSFAKSYTPGGE